MIVKLDQNQTQIRKKSNTLKSINDLYDGRELILNKFKSWIFPSKLFVIIWKRFKRLAPKQMLQRLPTVLAQVKTGNASENLLNEMWQIIYFL